MTGKKFLATKKYSKKLSLMIVSCHYFCEMYFFLVVSIHNYSCTYIFLSQIYATEKSLVNMKIRLTTQTVLIHHLGFTFYDDSRWEEGVSFNTTAIKRSSSQEIKWSDGRSHAICHWAVAHWQQQLENESEFTMNILPP